MIMKCNNPKCTPDQQPANRPSARPSAGAAAQDAAYGIGMRVFNECKDKSFRCTVCGMTQGGKK